MAEKNQVPDTSLPAIESFLGQALVASWMRQPASALRDYLAARGGSVARPSHVLGDLSQRPPGDTLTSRLWSILLESRAAYAGRFKDNDKNNTDPTNPLDSLPWEEASVRGGPSFIYKGISFAVR